MNTSGTFTRFRIANISSMGVVSARNRKHALDPRTRPKISRPLFKPSGYTIAITMNDISPRKMGVAMSPAYALNGIFATNNIMDDTIINITVGTMKDGAITHIERVKSENNTFSVAFVSRRLLASA